ncbi:MAG: hypothetical protein ABW179_09340 [Methylobacterium sp.]
MALAGAFASGAHAQSMTPMRGEVRSLTDSFAVRVYPSNPYDRPIRVEIRVYDQDFVPIEDARISADALMLAAQASRPVIVAIPFAGRNERRVRICAESIPFPNTQAQVRAQICGRFLGKRAF